ncbi:CCM1 Mitochondrial group I intron splicing factor CCM1 [Candida maltosa Xu316]|uniref:Mitochondrial 15S rRNA processing factor CCM1 n=1 Tax=Candida maltosa (strain Xu316) TaxID=1245528 RepID=M3J7L8_CANMX|nr:hypothetical protein G210_1436 [Candida maltosa Xu316]
MIRSTVRQNNSLLLLSKRCLFVPSSSITNRPKRKLKPFTEPKLKPKPKPRSTEEQPQPKPSAVDIKLQSKAKHSLKGLRSLSREISHYISPDALTTTIKPGIKDLPPIDIEDTSDDIFNQINNSGTKELEKPKPPPSLMFPEQINQRLGLVSDMLIQPNGKTNLPQEIKNNNWNMLLIQLDQTGGFKGLTQKDITHFIRKIPLKNLKSLIPHLEKMHHDAGLTIHYNVYYLFTRALTTGGRISDLQLKMVERYFDEISKQTELKIDHYETMVYAYVKNNNMTKVDDVLKIMKDKDIPISKSIYTAVFQGYSFYQKNHDKALEVFDAMKFFSKETSPDENVYTDVIISCVANRQLEKGLDLYQEFQDNNLKVNQRILSALAKGCSRSRQYKFDAWNYIFQIYDYGWAPTLQTYEHMLYISATDGDVELTRALFYKLLESNSVSGQAFISLMLSYSKYIPPSRRTEPFLASLTDKGRLFRQGILNGVDFTKPVQEFPFLPFQTIPDTKFILAESSAVWAHAIIKYPQFVRQHQVVTSYLTVALELGEFEEFKDRFDASTYLNTEGIPKAREVEIIEPDQENDTTDEVKQQDSSSSNELIKSPIFKHLEPALVDNRFKAARDSFIYNIAIRAAGRFKKYEFAQDILKERGQYRKSNNFKRLTPKEQEREDFQFASYLVECWTNMNLLEDAYAVVLSSVERFPWSWKQLGVLSRAAMKLGSLSLVESLKNVVRFSQEKNHGKIKYIDFKTYVMNRGY